MRSFNDQQLTDRITTTQMHEQLRYSLPAVCLCVCVCVCVCVSVFLTSGRFLSG